MPYIHPDVREGVLVAANPGELNYQITDLINAYLHRHGLSYQVCNDIVGALDNAKHEFQRRVQDPYEDLKIQENGDVYDAEYLSLE